MADAIHTSIYEIDSFESALSNNLDRIRNIFNDNSGIFDQAYAIFVNNNTLVQQIGDESFKNIQSDISYASWIISKNESTMAKYQTELSRLNQLISEQQTVVNQCRQEVSNCKSSEDPSAKQNAQAAYNNALSTLNQLQSQKRNVEAAIENVENAIQKLREIITDLQRKADEIMHYMSVCRQQIDTLHGQLNKLKSNFQALTEQVSSFKNVAKNAKSFVKEIDIQLSKVSGSVPSDSKKIHILSSQYLSEYGNMLSRNKDDINQRRIDLNQQVDILHSVMQDEVTRNSIEHCLVMLQEIEEETENFKRDASCFQQAAIALEHYKNLVRN